MPKIKYIPDKATLLALNQAAINNGYNRAIEPVKLLNRVPDAHYPITQSLLHDNDQTVRCRIILNDEGGFTYLDMSMDAFNSLPEYQQGEGK